VEKGISEQVCFLHLNRVSSSIVIKVDFDLAMSITAHNLYRLLAIELKGYEQCQGKTLFNKFIDDMGSIRYSKENVEILLKKKQGLSLLLEMMNKFEGQKVLWMENRSLAFSDALIS
jgi:replicative superfamily II helicase